MPIIVKFTFAEQKKKQLLQHSMTNTRIRQELLIVMRNVASNDTVLGTVQIEVHEDINVP